MRRAGNASDLEGVRNTSAAPLWLLPVFEVNQEVDG